MEPVLGDSNKMANIGYFHTQLTHLPSDTDTNTPNGIPPPPPLTFP
jgi:hypothetical protein